MFGGVFGRVWGRDASGSLDITQPFEPFFPTGRSQNREAQEITELVLQYDRVTVYNKVTVDPKNTTLFRI